MIEELRTEFEKAITTKHKLATKITEQMADDVKAGVLNILTVQQNKLALDNFDAAQINLNADKFEDAVHFFSRGCANLGEFKGRSDKERGLP